MTDFTPVHVFGPSEASKRALAKYLATKDQEIIDEAYKSFVALFPKVPYVTDDAIRAAIAVTDHPKAATANPKDFYDNRFLQELENSGFVKQLYAKVILFAFVRKMKNRSPVATVPFHGELLPKAQKIIQSEPTSLASSDPITMVGLFVGLLC